MQAQRRSRPALLGSLHWVGYIGCVWVNQNYRNIVLPCIPDTLHGSRTQISLIIINRYQVVSLIHHVAIPFDITLPAVLVPNHFFLAAMPQDKLHPALASFIPLGIMADKRQGYDQLNVTISRLLLQAENFFRRPHKSAGQILHHAVSEKPPACFF